MRASILFLSPWFYVLWFGIGFQVVNHKIGKGDLNMGGDKNRIEPTSCQKWEQNKELWTEILDGGLAPYSKSCMVKILG